MAQFNYMNDINSMFNMEGEISKHIPRYMRKIENSSFNANASINTSKAKLSVSYNNGYAAMASSSTSVNKTPNKNSLDNTNKGKKTPNGKSPSRKTPTPNKNGSKTPSGASGDRFIPNRSAMNFELGHYLMKQDPSKDNDNSEENVKKSPNQIEKSRLLSESLHGGDIKNKRILAYQNKAPAAPDSHLNPLRVVYSVQTPMSQKSGSRYIPTSPERILDAPDIINDYYLNLLDWSSDNVVTVALGSAVYLWNAATGNIDVLFENDNGENACSLSWIQEGHILAVGNNTGSVELWDCSQMKRLRVMPGHSARVGSLSWNSYMLSSGSRNGQIIHHDVRQRESVVARLNGHTQEVCGLKWSPDAKYLASGGNDNLVNIWPGTGTTPVHVLNQHQAAVRALAWCPWQGNILATGGGTADRCIKFWNVSNGHCLNSVDTKSQVCSLLFSKNYKELISAHGYANNQLTIWKYPSMAKQVDLNGHTQRVLQMAMSPDGSTVMSAGADETLRIWNCFAPDPNQNKKAKNQVREKPSVFKQSIR